MDLPQRVTLLSERPLHSVWPLLPLHLKRQSPAQTFLCLGKFVLGFPAGSPDRRVPPRRWDESQWFAQRFYRVAE